MGMDIDMDMGVDVDTTSAVATTPTPAVASTTTSFKMVDDDDILLNNHRLHLNILLLSDITNINGNSSNPRYSPRRQNTYTN